MRKILLLLLTGILAIPVLAQQEDSPIVPRSLFKVSPQHFTINTLKLSAEIFNKQRDKSFSVSVYGRFDSTPNYDIYYYGDDRYKGIGGELQYRKYISPIKSLTTRRNKNFLQGIYVGGYLQGAAFSNDGEYVTYTYDPNTNQQISTTTYVEESIGNWGTGFTIGVHRTLWSVLYVDAYVGGGIQWSDITRSQTPTNTNYYDYYYGGIVSPHYQGIMPKFGILLGVAL
jgi:hypothetical protein